MVLGNCRPSTTVYVQRAGPPGGGAKPRSGGARPPPGPPLATCLQVSNAFHEHLDEKSLLVQPSLLVVGGLSITNHYKPRASRSGSVGDHKNDVARPTFRATSIYPPWVSRSKCFAVNYTKQEKIMKRLEG